MREVIHPPKAPAMLASLRALGYSFEAAIADIVDNSVAAGASQIEVQFRTEPQPYVAVVDDGQGMSERFLLEAMRHGGTGPEAERDARDLGRFGLGLKTASLSQCRRLTVVSLQSGLLAGAAWDLDRVEQANDWILQVLDTEEAAAVPHVKELMAQGRGTVVLWQGFDRATAGESSEARALGELVDLAAGHLSLVFHRFLVNEEGERALAIAVNNRPLEPVDPFLTSHPSTQMLPPEAVRIEGVTVTLRPYILPHLSKMSAADLVLAGGEDGLRRNQGFYVYRNRRLITYGTWFRLIRQEELTKLARVQVDIPNSLDHLWALDVKKSMAFPPEAARAGFRRVVDRIAGTSRHVYQFRGRRASSGEVTHLWDRLIVRAGVEYRINREHPLVVAVGDIEEASTRLDQLLRSIEMSIPTDSLYADMAADRNVQKPASDDDIAHFLRDLADRMVDALGSDDGAVARLLDGLDRLEPFSAHPLITRNTAEVIRNARG
jgi:Histidine kinase-, DNA gyrase B-, and HSP90-like ATPase